MTRRADALQSFSACRASNALRNQRKMYLLILDSVGNTELLLILVAALIFFGPRKLPQLSRQIGRSLSDFRRASDDFKRTWEREVNLENFENGFDPQQESTILDKASDRIRSAREAVAGETNFEDSEKPAAGPVIMPVDPSLTEPRGPKPATETATTEQPKHEWL